MAVVGAGGLASTPARSDVTIRHGIQIGALGALRTTLPNVEKTYDLKYDIKDFRDSTSALLALDAVSLAVDLLEDCPLFNAGHGAVFTHAGTHELDAAVMDAYGFDPKRDVLAQLLELNLDCARREREGELVRGPGAIGLAGTRKTDFAVPPSKG